MCISFEMVTPMLMLLMMKIKIVNFFNLFILHTFTSVRNLCMFNFAYFISHGSLCSQEHTYTQREMRVCAHTKCKRMNTYHLIRLAYFSEQFLFSKNVRKKNNDWQLNIYVYSVREKKT